MTFTYMSDVSLGRRTNSYFHCQSTHHYYLIHHLISLVALDTKEKKIERLILFKYKPQRRFIIPCEEMVEKMQCAQLEFDPWTVLDETGTTLGHLYSSKYCISCKLKKIIFKSFSSTNLSSVCSYKLTKID